VPAIIGSDMKTYGPFEAEDIASLPAENAKILVKQGLAEKVEVSP
jgi:DNA replication initiation complex subunit (GINS family)